MISLSTKPLTNLENKRSRSVDGCFVMNLDPIARTSETNIRTLSRRDFAARHLRAHRRGSTFPGSKHLQAGKPLCIRYSFPIPHGKVGYIKFLLSIYSSLSSDPTDELLMIIGIFSHFFAVETTLAERQFFRALAKLIGRRAARLSACGIAAIVGKMGYLDEGCSVGADGSLYNVSVNPIISA